MLGLGVAALAFLAVGYMRNSSRRAHASQSTRHLLAVNGDDDDCEIVDPEGLSLTRTDGTADDDDMFEKLRSAKPIDVWEKLRATAP